jgi:anti-anti-sigma factor
MELTLLPLQKDDVVRVRTEGAISCRQQDDPLLTLLGPYCYTHKVLLNLERSPSIDTSGVCWLVHSSKRFAQSGGKLVMYGLTPMVFDVLGFLRLLPLLPIVFHEQDAVKKLEEAVGDSIPADRSSGPSIRFPR